MHLIPCTENQVHEHSLLTSFSPSSSGSILQNSDERGKKKHMKHSTVVMS